MLELTTLIGSGRERDVFLHPGRDDRIIKIMKPEATVDRNAVESWFLARAKRPRGAVTIPALHGWVETDRGPGLVYQHIRDEGGTTSRSLTQLVNEGILEEKLLKAAFEMAIASLRENAFLIYDPRPDNILMMKADRAGGRRLVLVDGFGPNVVAPRAMVRMLVPPLARRKIDSVRARAHAEWYAS